MNVLLNINLGILVFLAISSGITKIMLMPQEVEFFGNAGFNSTLIIIFGAFQLLGGVLLILQKTRFAGAVIVAATFALSAALLIVAGNILFAVISIVAMAMLGVVMKQNIEKRPPVSA